MRCCSCERKSSCDSTDDVKPFEEPTVWKLTLFTISEVSVKYTCLQAYRGRDRRKRRGRVHTIVGTRSVVRRKNFSRGRRATVHQILFHVSTRDHSNAYRSEPEGDFLFWRKIGIRSTSYVVQAVQPHRRQRFNASRMRDVARNLLNQAIVGSDSIFGHQFANWNELLRRIDEVFDLNKKIVKARP